MGVIYLDSSLLIGTGSNRACYRHPDDENKCIKVTLQGKLPRRHQNPREFKYYRLLEKRGIDWEQIARCYGWVETNLGMGLVFRRVIAHDGSSLPNLQQACEQGWVERDHLFNELQSLKNWLMKHAIIVSDLKLENMIYVPHNEPGRRIVLVDGVNNRNAIKLANYLFPLARSKMRRVWDRFSRRLLNEGMIRDRV